MESRSRISSVTHTCAPPARIRGGEGGREGRPMTACFTYREGQCELYHMTALGERGAISDLLGLPPPTCTRGLTSRK